MQPSGCGVIRQSHLIALMQGFVMGCVVLLMVVGCAGVRPEAPKEQGHTEVTKEQAHTEPTEEQVYAETTLEKQSQPQATSSAAASSEAPCSQTRAYNNLRVFRLCKLQARSPKATTEETRCERTRAFKDYKRWAVFTTNDVPGCPKGGLLSGTDKPNNLAGKDGGDEIRGLGAGDIIEGGTGNDVIYGGPGNDQVLDGNGEDVLYGGAGKDFVILKSGPLDDRQRDKVYCGPGKDRYGGGKQPETTIVAVDELDYVDSSCEEKVPIVGGPL